MNDFFESCVQNALSLVDAACNQKCCKQKPKIVLGLSCGPDSTFLLYVLHELQKQNQLELIATHLDHQWRSESWRDVEFCSGLCQKLGVEFVAKKAQDLGLKIKFNGSKEEVGRKLRRTLFQQVLKEKNADFIALAHHLQDQQETFFIRLLRGASLSGLCCMQAIDGTYIRPLLNVDKREILAYLDSNQIKYLIDSTNISQDYLRNRIRLNVIPALEQCDSRFNQKFQDTLNQLKLEDEFIQDLAEQEFIRIFDQKLKGYVGSLSKFRALNPVLVRRVMICWLIKERVNFNLSSRYLGEITKFLNSGRGGSHFVGINWKIHKKSDLFWIEPI